ncbi:alpha/beta hydrolase [Anaerohalosphaera lusitana]|nr:alpha/beta hydrolase [Anaerohalosphaera lusitana]
MDEKRHTIQSQLQPLSQANGEYPQAVKEYFDHYGLGAGEGRGQVEHLFGTFESQGYTLAGHIYRPESYKATVVLMHGYLNHCGQLRYIIEYLLDHGFAVAAYDKPGHGLSSGERAAVESFDVYRKALRDFRDEAAKYLDGPYHVVAFSNGACPVIQDVLGDEGGSFERVVLAAPLVRPVAWKQTKFTYPLYSRFVTSVKRLPRCNTNNKEFIRFNRNEDFLHARAVPLVWVKALFDWNDWVERAKPSDKEVLIVQGDRDGTVDWVHNIAFLESKLPNARVELVEGAKHELFNESLGLREQVFGTVVDYLDGKG